MKKRRPELETRQLQSEKKLTGKGKHIVKVRNHPHTKLAGRLKDKSSKITCIHNKQLRDTQNN